MLKQRHSSPAAFSQYLNIGNDSSPDWRVYFGMATCFFHISPAIWQSQNPCPEPMIWWSCHILATCISSSDRFLRLRRSALNIKTEPLSRAYGVQSPDPWPGRMSDTMGRQDWSWGRGNVQEFIQQFLYNLCPLTCETVPSAFRTRSLIVICKEKHPIGSELVTYYQTTLL